MGVDCAPLPEGHNWQPAGGSPRARRWSLLFYVMTPSGARGSRRQISGLLGAKEGLAWAGLLSGCGVRPGPTQALSHCLGRSGQRSDPPHLPLALGLRNESSLLRGYPGRPRRKPGLGSQETPTPRSLDLSSVGPCLSGHNPARREVSQSHCSFYSASRSGKHFLAKGQPLRIPTLPPHFLFSLPLLKTHKKGWGQGGSRTTTLLTREPGQGPRRQPGPRAPTVLNLKQTSRQTSAPPLPPLAFGGQAIFRRQAGWRNCFIHPEG